MLLYCIVHWLNLSLFLLRIIKTKVWLMHLNFKIDLICLQTSLVCVFIDKNGDKVWLMHLNFKIDLVCLQASFLHVFIENNGDKGVINFNAGLNWPQISFHCFSSRRMKTMVRLNSNVDLGYLHILFLTDFVENNEDKVLLIHLNLNGDLGLFTNSISCNFMKKNEKMYSKYI